MIGRKLDKYEILEEVGQGGMAVVYKGLDTSLHREVAVKILHPHLASHAEARRRFEREARAVAKLRHENILEIFDYSGKESADSYIVTEFIRGHTLKEFITEHQIAFPEIGALIVAEVCRALGHAHSLGVLHRDVKPENIMIRDDGMVKLMDFGIAQIVDAQRMTVTGQLLGSPAYMSPEHVEGKNLDFRTDVFSVGILLYQVTTGELPFKGRNPHEILKRIADCKFIEARVVNPLVGDRLNKIINKALAREPDDRYQDVHPLLDDLVRFLAEAELTEPRVELGRFFEKPVPYEQALRQRLIAALSKRGKEELLAKKAGLALELFNRVLTIDPSNQEVLAEIDRMSRRQRLARFLAVGGGIVVVAGVAGLAVWRIAEHEEKPVLVASTKTDAGLLAALTTDAGPRTTSPDASVVVVMSTVDAGTNTHRHRLDGGNRITPIVRRTADAGGVEAVVSASREVTILADPRNLEYSIDDGAWTVANRGSVPITVGPGRHKLAFRHDLCEDKVAYVEATDPAGLKIDAHLSFKPGRVYPVCANASAVFVNGSPVTSGTHVTVPLKSSRMPVMVEFLVAGDRIEKKAEVVAGGDEVRVSCE